jgi:hypothetical protein
MSIAPRPAAADSTLSQAMKLVARGHQSLIWERTRHVLRLRSTLREYFPAALEAVEDLDSSEALELLAAAPDPDRAARLSKARIAAALRRAHRRKVAERSEIIYSTLRAAALRQPPAVQSAFAVITASEVRVISTLTGEIDALGRYADARARRNYAGTSPITKASEPKGLCWRATPAIGDSATRYANGPSDRCGDHQERGSTTMRCAPARSATKPRCGSSATASSESCPAA